jgi:prevent-host-death family protein
MDTVSLADAKARLSELVDRVEAGDRVRITRRGRTVAELSAAERSRKPVDAAALAALTSSLPPSSESSAELVRAMRDGDRF